MVSKDKGKFITLNVSGEQVNTHYYEVGEGKETIVFVQTGGFGTSAYMCWYLNLEFFARAGYHVYAPDSVGFGWTERVARPTLPSEFLYTPLAIKFLVAFMDAMRVERAHFICNSMGSNAVTRFAFEEPNRVKSMILTGGEPRVETEESGVIAKNLGRTPTMNASRAIVNKPKLRFEDVKQATFYFFYDPDHPRIDEIAEMRLEVMNRPGIHERTREDVMRMPERGRFHYHPSDLARIQAPTYLIHGRDERFFYPEEIAQTLMEYAMKVALVIPDCSLTLLPYCGHWPQIEMPERFDALALEFLRSLKKK
jgi:2-hydroxy-6-oxonona-2,4-dienedioate hydrolase